jgi:hypothetical protein
MKTGLSILLALLMTAVLVIMYRLHMLHRLWMKWNRTRQVRRCPISEPPMAGPLPPLVIRLLIMATRHAQLAFKGAQPGNQTRSTRTIARGWDWLLGNGR